MNAPTIRLTLVSQSPRRANLLALLNIPFDIVVARSSELWLGRQACEIAQENAVRKLQACIPVGDRHRLLLAADTLIQVGRHFLGKPIAPEAFEPSRDVMNYDMVTGFDPFVPRPGL
jgi:septum formation protein